MVLISMVSPLLLALSTFAMRREGSPRSAAREAARKIKQYYSKPYRRTRHARRSNVESVVNRETSMPQEMQPATRRQHQDDNNYHLPQPELPIELWHRILRDMYPSQLTELALASWPFYEIVEREPIWRNILADYPQLHTPRRVDNEPETRHFSIVLSRSRFICERCYGHCPAIGAHKALPVFIDSERKYIRLCITCRQAHFDAHPELSDGDGGNYRAYGGRVGLNAELEHLRNLEEENERNMLDTREQRRRMLETALAVRGVPMNENERMVSNFIDYGHGRNLQAAVEGVILRMTRDARRENLERRLHEVGLRLRDNSRICQAYIRFAVGDIDSVVTTMVEMDWLFRVTVYRSLAGVADDFDEINSENGSGESYLNASDNEIFFRHQGARHNVDSEEQKTAALADYIHRRLRERRWNDVSSDEDTPDRPPQSLWPRIRSLTQKIWLVQVKGHFLAATVRRFESLFLTLDPMDTDSFSNELLKRNLDFGAIDATCDGTQLHREPLIPFSTALEISLGEEEFTNCLNMLRQLIFQRTRSIYVAKALVKDLPQDISAFITSCNSNPGLTLDGYNARESEFISERVPIVAAQEKVHICYVLYLLDTLKRNGHIQLFGIPTL